MKKKNFGPSDFKYEPIQQEKKPYWMTQVEGPGRTHTRADSFGAIAVAIMAALLIIYLLINYTDEHTGTSERVEDGRGNQGR